MTSFYTLWCIRSVVIFCFVFPFRSSGDQLGCTIAGMSAQRLVVHVTNALQNITTEGTSQSVDIL